MLHMNRRSLQIFVWDWKEISAISMSSCLLPSVFLQAMSVLVRHEIAVKQRFFAGNVCFSSARDSCQTTMFNARSFKFTAWICRIIFNIILNFKSNSKLEIELSWILNICDNEAKMDITWNLHFKHPKRNQRIYLSSKHWQYLTLHKWSVEAISAHTASVNFFLHNT